MANDLSGTVFNLPAGWCGILGSLLATLGVVLPSFIIILLIAAVIRNFLKYKGIQAFLSSIRPCVVGLILATPVTLFLNTVVGMTSLNSKIAADFKGLAIFGILLAGSLISAKIFKKKPSPILMILISAGLGMLLYSV